MVLAQISVSGTEAVKVVNWFTQHAGWGWTVGIVAVAILVAFFFLFYRPLRKRVPRDKALSKELYEQAQAGIDIRDKQVAAAKNLGGFIRAQRDYGAWYGRNRYIAEQLRDRFPDEAERFIRHGKSDLQFQVVASDEMQTALNHLGALIGVRVEALRALAKTLHENARTITP